MSATAETEAILVAPGQPPDHAALAKLAASAAGRSIYLLGGRSWDATASEATPCPTTLAVPAGLASVIRYGIERVDADRLAVVDGGALRHPGSSVEVVDALFASLRAGQDVAVAAYRSPAARAPWYGGVVSWLARRLVRRSGVAQPLAACFAFRRAAWQAVAPRLDAGDRTFLLDLLAACPAARVAEVVLPGAAAGTGGAPTLAASWEVLVSALRSALPLRVPRRWLSFAGVGALGTVTDVACTGVGLALGLPFGWARSSGVLIGMVQNYLLNNSLTFAADGQPATLRGLALYGVCQALGTGANWGLSMATFAAGAPWFIALLVGVLAGNILNFLTASWLVWPGPTQGAARSG